MSSKTTSPAGGPGSSPGRKVFNRRRGEVIEIAIAAGLNVHVHVLKIDRGQVSLLCIAPKEVLLRGLSRQEAPKHARRRRA